MRLPRWLLDHRRSLCFTSVEKATLRLLRNGFRALNYSLSLTLLFGIETKFGWARRRWGRCIISRCLALFEVRQRAQGADRLEHIVWRWRLRVYCRHDWAFRMVVTSWWLECHSSPFGSLDLFLQSRQAKSLNDLVCHIAPLTQTPSELRQLMLFLNDIIQSVLKVLV